LRKSWLYNQILVYVSLYDNLRLPRAGKNNDKPGCPKNQNKCWNKLDHHLGLAMPDRSRKSLRQEKNSVPKKLMTPNINKNAAENSTQGMLKIPKNSSKCKSPDS
jgi:hypothetical protein